MRYRLDLGLGATLLGSLVLNGFLLARGSPPENGDVRRAASANPPGRAIPCTLPPEPASNTDDHVGPNAPAAGFDAENRDPSWATAQEAAIEAHLADMLVEPLELSVECRSRCCAITGKDALSPGLVLDLQTSAGLMPWSDGLQFSNRVVACFDPAKHKNPPTALARRRKEILAQLKPALARCAQLTNVPVEVTVLVGFDTSGAVIGTNRQGELSGSEAARCADKEISAAASFGPQPHPDGIPFFIHLEPAE